MGSIVSAITGAGSKKAASVQAGAAREALDIEGRSLAEQIRLGREALETQKQLFQQSLSLTQPYRDAGTVATSVYESLIYGVPIEKTASYNGFQPQQQTGVLSKSFDQLYSEMAPQFITGKKGSEYGKWVKSGDSWSWSGGGDYTLHEKDLRDAVTARMAQEQQAAQASGAETKDALYAPYEHLSSDPMDYIKSTPGYQARLDESQRAIESSAAARSGVLSGANVMALERNAQNFATNEFDNVLARLSGLINTGATLSGQAAGTATQVAGQQTGVLGQMMNANANYGNTAGQLKTQIGAAQASGYLGQQAAGTNLVNNAFAILGAKIGGGGQTQYSPMGQDITWNQRF